MKRSRSVAGALLVSTFAAVFMAGCAQNPDVRDGHDYTSGTTAKNPPAYLGCVKGELPGNVKTFEVESDNSVRLFIESTDPSKAGGLVELRSTGASTSSRPINVMPGTTMAGCWMPR